MILRVRVKQSKMSGESKTELTVMNGKYVVVNIHIIENVRRIRLRFKLNGNHTIINIRQTFRAYFYKLNEQSKYRGKYAFFQIKFTLHEDT